MLDELRGCDYTNDERFQRNGNRFNNKKKRNQKDQLNRKDRRKQQRLEKKHKGKQVTVEPTVKKFRTKSSNPSASEKSSQNSKKKSTLQEEKLPFSSDDELSSGDFDEFDENDLDEEEWEQLRELEDDDEEDEEEPMAAQETMMKLSALKKNKKIDKKHVSFDIEDDEESGEDISDSNKDFDSELESDTSDNEMTVEETMAALKALKDNKKNGEQEPHSESEEDDQSGFNFDSYEDMVDDNDFESDSDTSDKEMTVDETMAALKALKGKNPQDNSEPEKKSTKKSRKKDEVEEEDIVYELPPSERAVFEKDEMEMQYYAKKLKLKGKSKKIRASDDFDAIGGLLEGLEYFENYGEGDEDYGDLAFANKSFKEDSESESESESESAIENNDAHSKLSNVKTPFSSDDELSSGDFDEFDEDDLDEEEWEQLRELEEGSEGNDNITEGKKSKKNRIKENPYVAPTQKSSSEYIPPSMRMKKLDDNNNSAVVVEIRKKVMSSLNKLSETNITVIISSLNDLYDTYPRQYVTEVLTKQILEIVGQKNKLLDSFIMNYSAVAYSLWKLRGVEVGASFVQSTVEVFLQHFEAQIRSFNDENNKITDSNGGEKEEAVRVFSKECTNIATLLAYCYNFGFITCKLIYNVIELFVSTPNEFTTELLLRVIAVSGPLIRGDDPSALKDILSELLINVKSIKHQGPRLKFLLDTMADLKNNRLKPSMLAASNQQLKKTLTSTLKVAATNEPLQVSLDDIRNVDTKGKWWLVGASWKGNMEHAFEKAQSQVSSSSQKLSKVIIEDTLLDEIPNWTEISKRQRMNTDVRRAIFISIMSAQDYIEAFSKIEKLNLKNKQVLEVPKVILHCLLTDCVSNGYNPYYALVTSKVCEHHRQLLKSFQFLFWDTVKKFEEDNVDYSSNDDDNNLDEDKRLKRISGQGKFFGSLISDSILQLDAFKHVPMMGGLNSDGILFIEVVLYQLLLATAKKCETKTKNKSGKKNVSYRSDSILKLIGDSVKLDNKPIILKGLKWFVEKKLKFKNYLVGMPGSKEYERDSRRMEWVIPEFIEIISEELETSQ